MSSRRRLALYCPFLLGLAIVAACQNDDNRPPESVVGIGSIPPGGSTEAGIVFDSGIAVDSGILPDGGVCNLVDFTGAAVDENALDDEPPSPLGGTITDGTYTLIDYTLYNGLGGTTAGPTGTSLKATMVITGGLIVDRIQEFTGPTTSAVDETIEGTFLANGSGLSFFDTCPITQTETLAYTVSPPTLVITNLLTKEVFTYTEQ